MTTATLNTPSMASAPSTDIRLALQELGAALYQLARAIWITFTPSFTGEVQLLTPQQVAQQAAHQAALELRVFASAIAANDPAHASELFAAADRYEFGDNS